MSPRSVEHFIEEFVHAEWGRLLASLIKTLRDFELAEDCLQEALVAALEHWGKNGMPASPAGWLLQVARRKAIDRIRRSKNFDRKQSEYAYLLELENEPACDMENHEIPDERLRLIFTCCHPALDEKSRIALTLRTLGGLKTPEIASAFLDKEEAMAQRLVRAKRKIKIAGIAYKIPEQEDWDERLSSVLNVLYLVFNEGYSASDGEDQIRADLCEEAIRLASAINDLKPQEPEIMGLLALMLLHDSRRAARVSVEAVFPSLEDQDRSLWNNEKIGQGRLLIREALKLGRVGPFQIQAAISAIHSEAETYGQTNWQEITLLYDLLYKMQENPVVLLNKAVAVSYAQSPHDALKILEEIEKYLSQYQPFHAAKADFLRRCEMPVEAAEAYVAAIVLTENSSEKAFLEARLKSITH